MELLYKSKGHKGFYGYQRAFLSVTFLYNYLKKIVSKVLVMNIEFLVAIDKRLQTPNQTVGFLTLCYFRGKYEAMACEVKSFRGMHGLGCGCLS